MMESATSAMSQPRTSGREDVQRLGRAGLTHDEAEPGEGLQGLQLVALRFKGTVGDDISEIVWRNHGVKLRRDSSHSLNAPRNTHVRPGREPLVSPAAATQRTMRRTAQHAVSTPYQGRRGERGRTGPSNLENHHRCDGVPAEEIDNDAGLK